MLMICRFFFFNFQSIVDFKVKVADFASHKIVTVCRAGIAIALWEGHLTINSGT